MKKFKFGQEYYLTNYEEMNEFLKFVLNDDKDKRIKYIFLNSGLTWSDTNHGKRYDTLSDVFIVFDNDAVLKINYLFYSLMYIEYTWLQNIPRRDKEYNNDNFKLELDVANTSIENFSIERFSESYEIDPSSCAVRPEGDYFKKIILKLSNGSNLCICAQDSESDGYCDIWVENTIEKIEENIRNSKETVDAKWIKEWAVTFIDKDK